MPPFLGKGIGDFEQSQPFSIDFWIYPNEIYPEASVFSRSNQERHGFKGYNLYLKDNRLRFVMSHAWPHDNLEVISEQALPAKQWSHVTLTYAGTGRADGVHLYLEWGAAASDHAPRPPAKERARRRKDPSFLFVDRGFALGARLRMKSLKNGGIDEPRLFDRQLADLEVLYLHDASDPRRCAEPAPRLRHRSQPGCRRGESRFRREPRLTREAARDRARHHDDGRHGPEASGVHPETRGVL